MERGRTVMYIVEFFDDWYWKTGNPNPKYFDRFEHAEEELKRRFGLERFQPNAHLRRRISGAALPTRDYGGYTWSCVWCEEYANVPRSHQQFDHCSGVRLLRMDREARPLPFKNPFERTRVPTVSDCTALE
jgi:hypothetical protein